MMIRKATKEDYEAVWYIFSEVVKKGDSYTFDENTDKSNLEKYWFAFDMQTYVITDEDDSIVGTYIIKYNYPGRGSHVANASYMVKPSAQGKGIGQLLLDHSLQIARKSGFLAMQFNIVVSTNKNAIYLWEKNGFSIIGTTPNGFRHKELGLVDTHIMYKEL